MNPKFGTAHLVFFYFIFSFCLDLFSQEASSGSQKPEVLRAPTADWIQNVDIPDSSSEKSVSETGGLRYLLAETQVNLSSQERFTHVAFQILSAKGLEENSQISIDFDPFYESITLNSLRIHREKSVFDRLPDQQISVIQREKNLEHLEYNERKTGQIILENIQIGDIIEYSYTRKGANPVFESHYADAFATELSIPIDRLRYRIVLPHGSRTKYRCYGRTSDFVKVEGTQFDEWIWSEDNLPAKISEGNLPLAFNPWAWIQVSDYQSWEEVADWGRKLFTSSGELPAGLQPEIEKIKKEPDEERRVVLALRFVQDKIRYLARPVAENSYRPFPLSTILQRGYGDCKDKSAMLAAMLNSMGIVARPALVDSTGGDYLSNCLPSPLVFDHAIVLARVGKSEFWLDPTRTAQGGTLRSLALPEFKRALVLEPGTSRLTFVFPNVMSQAGILTEEHYQISSFKSPAQLTVKTSYRGYNADYMRTKIANTSARELKQVWVNYISKRFSKVEPIGEVKYSDDRENNLITIETEFRSPDMWKPMQSKPGFVEVNFFPQSIANALIKPTQTKRSMPIGIPYPESIIHQITIQLPITNHFKKQETSVKNSAFEYQFKSKPEAKSLTLIHQFKTLRAEVQPDQAAGYIEDLEKVNTRLDYSIQAPLEHPPLPWWQLVYWPLVAANLMTAILAIWIARWFCRRPLPIDRLPPPVPDPNLTGLQGWLILVGFGIISRCIALILGIFHSTSNFNSIVWQQISNPDSSAYNPHWGYFVYAATTLDIFNLVLSFTLLVTFFRRSPRFPRIIIGFFLFQIIIACFTFTTSSITQQPTQQFQQKHFTNLFQVIVQCCVWIPYFLVSQRVKLTFRNNSSPSSPDISTSNPDNSEI